MSKPNPHSGQKRKRSSEHSGGDLDHREKALVRRSPSSADKLTVSFQPPTQLGVSTTVQEPNQASRVDTWIADSQEQLHSLDQVPALSESTINLDSERLSLFSCATSKTAPLTKRNLKLLRQQTMPVNAGKDANPTTPSRSSTKSTGTANYQTLVRAHQLLTLNGMHVVSPFDMSQYPQIAQEADQLLVDRQSEKGRETAKLVTALKLFGNSNELTLCAKLMPLLQGEERSVEQQVREGESKTVTRAWSMDYLGENWNVQFRAGALPILKPGTDVEDRIFEEILKDVPKLSNPMPDILYGPYAASFSKDEQAVNNKFLEYSSISDGVFHPGFIWEWKGARGNMEEGQVQLCRAAAAVGYAMREFQRSLGINPDASMIDGVDVKSLVYAMCINNTNAWIYAGFYEKEGTSVVFRFLKVRRHSMEDVQGLSNIRQDVHNVLDWICDERLSWLKGIIAVYLKRDNQAVGSAGASTGEAASTVGSRVRERQRAGKKPTV